jgi:hypothetical protein
LLCLPIREAKYFSQQGWTGEQISAAAVIASASRHRERKRSDPVLSRTLDRVRRLRLLAMTPVERSRHAPDLFRASRHARASTRASIDFAKIFSRR